MRHTPDLPPLRRRRALAAGTALLGALSLSAVATGSADAAGSDQHVLVVGIDGLRYDKIAPADAPNLDAMIANGYSARTTLYANPFAPTLSGPGWATNLTGVWPDKHQVKSNSWGTSSTITSYPDFLTRLEQANPSLTTFAAASWNPIVDGSAGPPLITSKVDTVRAESEDDAKAASDTANQITSAAPNASFLHLDEVDEAGHASGGASQAYLDAVHDADARLGQVLRAVQARPSSERWKVIVTADHGHTDVGGHGGSTPVERGSFILETGPGIGRQTPAIAPKNVDIAAEVLSTFGVPLPAVLDGRPLATRSADPFDAMVGSLQARQDETGVPADVKGWTHSMPSGWSVDNTGMGTGGVTEWRGWALTTDDFWTRAAPDQGREGNVRERGVFAVADSDEWADKSFTGTFSSRIVSPAYDVSGRTRATVSFWNHYRRSGNQTAQVQVSVDGGAWTTAATYAADVVAQRSSVAVTLPAGAKTLRVRWALTNADNDWFWAIDEPSVS
ncbi:hypothetical protein GCM10011519_08960 [Marmoricola endophyticus]|uniref:Nucleotide pyrophosphatase n=1 Tax=Marmoricola endophyticus TaxID=2040280 RepID=A0A917BCZ3_9ACTN|nr:alkaline phosphatase family protein [Marmoricola endophyticus]GGF37610.1 hypothetical protein GCM10011519_08960 [Marmoricola endophyticus]